MTRGPFQEFDHEASPYERPNQNWVCGHLAAGRPCKIGPDGRGRCQATFECIPRNKDGRWVCTRTKNDGGRCEQGPLPDGTCCNAIDKCVPTRSLRAQRGKVALWAVALTIGILALLLHGPEAWRHLSPGPLTLQHAGLGGCETCHVDFDKGPSAWVHAAFGAGDALGDSKQCLDCHDLGEDAFSPHSLPAETLAGLSDAKASNRIATTTPANLKLAGLVFGSPMEEEEDFACATCHKEHKGTDFDLEAMSNGRCQSCHQARFASLAKGHPDFGDYPYQRRTKLIFNHESHIEKHFTEKDKDKAPETCISCHSPARDGGGMLVKDFDQVCAACHLSEIDGTTAAGSKGIAFITLPGLDLVTLEDRGVPIGEWPEDAEGALTPFVKMLLGSDPELRDDLTTFEAIDDTFDLEEASDEEIAAVERVAWAIKGLIHDVLTTGVEPLEGGIFGAMGQEADRAVLRPLLAGLSRGALRAAQASWFPCLYQDVAAYRADPELVMPLVDQVSEEGEIERCVPDSATSEEMAAEETEAQEVAEVEGAAEGEDILEDGEDILEEGEDILAEGEDILEDGEDILAEGEDILEEGEDILAEGEDEGILGDDEGILGDDEDILGDDEEEVASEDEESVALEEIEVAEDIDSEAWANLGGWYRQDFTLFYRPTGHSDGFLRSWLDFAGAAYGTPAEANGAALFAALSAKETPGKCAKCHSIDRPGDTGPLQVNWNPDLSQPGLKQATVFSHDTHFAMLDEKGCLTCHTKNPADLNPGESAYSKSFEHWDPNEVEANFHAMDSAVCAECHVAERAGDSCVLCHQYHVGQFPGITVKTEMRGEEG